ncbi:bifunctional 2-C-methyl-D-erythritol 4-phosphate cytidylyltransferase/2-C-methyl-D-erythritol 2,4-cyclodiphosphate synthase [Sphingomonas sp. S1-29]|uniref:bifunctional 2-C-methyl-D-erythritol 4-phosphate cytidylyltransferase/2-C-methyl-D-erythritol 2,4-cyclodiphosphate synthase n=1 Tax=Sphingomonas sp. S1-29 TaxID=2991074 RepID=UPI00223EB62E|nr:bifunctional 2-C-methyl-D-erythritol 4-phosphate cytidylyltransferase/2-C-methyl-D-erythritol 2,4-cyclodiphosphate synthase [Sphingomonas sp. S1-29]UZK69993.1 bifunctional 2-C-methyl-D-erythritol 4-phosphate cytidylyltransferase/2-C-methyl-D-erythritol 2,4-cyclodiphosphate synthase [Sphingomonas sp. S1-29]
MANHRTAALIVAAGQGIRAGSERPKQFATLAGKPMLVHSYTALRDHPAIETVLIAIGDGQQADLHAAVGDVRFVLGGATRRDSVRNGIDALIAQGFDQVLVHDAARPFLPGRVIDALLAALGDHPGAVPALPIADTLARAGDLLGDTVSRDGLWRIQTPQAFRLPELLAAHRAWPADAEATDDAQMLRAIGHGVCIVEGDRMLEKITHPADFAAAEAAHGTALISRSASGYDVHRLEVGEELWLGGVLIPHDKGLSGHSDADVGLHAITDALLGTIAAGDIGMHFPPSDPQWKGADSAQFLQHAAGLVTAQGGIIDFVDLTLICEAPKIGPHRDAIRARIGELLRLPVTCVSVKATTTERLGFTGRGEGIAAMATATVRIPGVI